MNVYEFIQKSARNFEIETGLRLVLKKYENEELCAYSFYESPEVIDWAIIFKGAKVWYAIVNGRRVTVKKAFNHIKKAKKSKKVYMSDDLRTRLFVEEL